MNTGAASTYPPYRKRRTTMVHGPNTVRMPPREPLVSLASLAWLVRIPGNVAALRAFTEAEVDEARRYADDRQGICDPLE